MTLEQKECLKKLHAEELEGDKKYEDMAYALKMNDDHHAAGILLDIAKDERSHAKALAHILEMGDKI